MNWHCEMESCRCWWWWRFCSFHFWLIPEHVDVSIWLAMVASVQARFREEEGNNFTTWSVRMRAMDALSLAHLCTVSSFVLDYCFIIIFLCYYYYYYYHFYCYWCWYYCTGLDNAGKTTLLWVSENACIFVCMYERERDDDINVQLFKTQAQIRYHPAGDPHTACSTRRDCK